MFLLIKVCFYLVNDCLRFGDESFKNLEFELSEKWTKKSLEMLESKDFPITKDETTERIRKILLKRKLMVSKTRGN